MTSLRDRLCIKACQGIGTGELAAIVDDGSTLKEQFAKVVEHKAAAVSHRARLRMTLTSVYSDMKKLCCGTVLEKDPILQKIQETLAGTSTEGYQHHRRVVCAANRYGDDLMLLGARHWDKQMHAMADKIGFVRADYDKEEQGFIDQFGVFMTREEAWQVAWDAGQIIRRVGGDGGCLYSENLY
jgi:hypothetical protein